MSNPEFNGPASLVVYDMTAVWCKWCGGRIRSYVTKIRLKESSRDRPNITGISDFHEECWCEAIEVQI